MAAEITARMLVEADGLGSGVIELGEKWTDSRTPDDYRRIETTISTTELLLSSMMDIPSKEVLGLVMKARGDTVFINTISANISTAGMAVRENQGTLLTFEPGNSCKISLKGNAVDAAITMLVFAAIT